MCQKIDFFKKQKNKKPRKSKFEGKIINLDSFKKGPKKENKEKSVSLDLYFYKKHDCMNINVTLPP